MEDSLEVINQLIGNDIFLLNQLENDQLEERHRLQELLKNNSFQESHKNDEAGLLDQLKTTENQMNFYLKLRKSMQMDTKRLPNEAALESLDNRKATVYPSFTTKNVSPEFQTNRKIEKNNVSHNVHCGSPNLSQRNFQLRNEEFHEKEIDKLKDFHEEVEKDRKCRDQEEGKTKDYHDVENNNKEYRKEVRKKKHEGKKKYYGGEKEFHRGDLKSSNTTFKKPQPLSTKKGFNLTSKNENAYLKKTPMYTGNVASFDGRDSKTLFLKERDPSILSTKNLETNECQSSKEECIKNREEFRKILLQERNEELNSFLISFEIESEREKEELRKSMHEETDQMKMILHHKLEAKKQQELEEIRTQCESQRQILKEKMESLISLEIDEVRETLSAEILRENESNLDKARNNLMDQCKEMYKQEMEDLKAALTAGAKRNLEDLRCTMEAEYNEKKDQIRKDAILESTHEIAFLKKVLEDEEQDKLDQIKIEAKKEHFASIEAIKLSLNEQNEKNLISLKEALTTEKELQITRIQLELEHENEKRVAEIERSCDAELQRKKKLIQSALADEFQAKVTEIRENLKIQSERAHHHKIQRFRQEVEFTILEVQRYLSNLFRPTSDDDVYESNLTPDYTVIENFQRHVYKELKVRLQGILKQYNLLQKEHSNLMNRLACNGQELFMLKRELSQKDSELATLQKLVQNASSFYQEKESSCKQKTLAQ